MHANHRFFVLALWLMLAGTLLAEPQEPAKQVAKTPPKIDAIDRALQRFVDAKQVAGIVTLVGHNKKIVHLSALGQRDVALAAPMKTSSLFSIASMTKPVVATAVMMLADEGKLDIDDPVGEYLPALAELKLADGAAVRAVTIRDALTHTAGFGGSQLFAGTLEAAVDGLAKKPLAFAPGSQWQYSPGINVVGRIVEVVSKQPLDEFLSQRIFAPLGMKSTAFTLNKRQRQRLATLYAPSEDKKSLVAVENYISSFQQAKVKSGNPSGGLASTARDMFRFYRFVLGEGKFRKQRLLSAKAVKQMTTVQTGELKTGFTPGNGWGLGWCVVREPQGVTEALSPGSFGHGGAFGTQGWVDPKEKIIYVLMIQRTKFGNSDGSEIRRAFQNVAKAALGS